MYTSLTGLAYGRTRWLDAKQRSSGVDWRRWRRLGTVGQSWQSRNNLNGVKVLSKCKIVIRESRRRSRETRDERSITQGQAISISSLLDFLCSAVVLLHIAPSRQVTSPGMHQLCHLLCCNATYIITIQINLSTGIARSQSGSLISVSHCYIIAGLASLAEGGLAGNWMREAANATPRLRERLRLSVSLTKSPSSVAQPALFCCSISLPFRPCNTDLGCVDRPPTTARAPFLFSLSLSPTIIPAELSLPAHIHRPWRNESSSKKSTRCACRG